MSKHAQLTARDIHGPFMQLLTNLQSQEGYLWLAALKRFLRKENPWPINASFQVWKTIKLGTCTSGPKYQTELTRAGRRLADYAANMLSRISCLQQEVELDLVVTTARELGFETGATYEDICARAVIMGLELCPAEIGPALRLIYHDQPRGEFLRIASEAMRVEDGNIFIFAVNHSYDGELWLQSFHGQPEHFWTNSQSFVFVRPGS